MRSASFLPLAVLALISLAACTPSVPESGEGVGFTDYGTYQQRQSAAARAASQPAARGPVVVPPPAGFNPAAAAAAIDRADGLRPVGIGATSPSNITSGAVIGGNSGVLDPNRPRGNAPAGIQVEAGEVQNRPTGISDENDFSAVSQRETIESDKARIERNKAQYVVVQPGALPQRTGDTGPNLVEYALATKHAPGAQLHKRSGFKSTNVDAACARYGSPDLAQSAFLEKGGPDRDRLGLDPDGDGFACSWDPRPFRAALQ